MAKPKIVCLCGSTRFRRQFADANFRETMAGRIVLSVGFASTVYRPTEEEKLALDVLHMRKIELADEILVIDAEVLCCIVCGSPDECSCEVCRVSRRYWGQSTSNEIAHAKALGKPVRYWSEECK